MSIRSIFRSLIPARLRKPVPAQAAAPTRRRPTVIITLTLKQLLNMGSCLDMLGPFSLKDWNDMYKDFYKAEKGRGVPWLSSSRDLDSFILDTTAALSDPSKRENEALISYGVGFMAGFTNYAARCDRHRTSGIGDFARAFAELRYTAARINQNPRMSFYDVSELLGECERAVNQFLQHHGQALKFL
jgi:hypothetical protein